MTEGWTASLLKGSLAGLSATWPMTATMLGLRDRLPQEWLFALPPRKISMRAAKKAGLLSHLDRKERTRFTWLSHFGFGAGAGILYALLPGGLRRLFPLAGPAYGMTVWAAAYLGLMPALGLYPSALRDRKSRNGLMVASHLVWGLSLGAAYGLLQAIGKKADI
jgi:uncharacterized membrane protein YagU involved in acid resistance